MAFIQLIEYTTSKPDEVRRTVEDWERATEDKRAANRIVLTKHHDDGDRYCEMVFFDSYDAAMENSNLPETQEYAKKMQELVDGDMTFFDLDVIEDEEL